MFQAHRGGGLIHLLPAMPAPAHKRFLQIFARNPQPRHAREKFAGSLAGKHAVVMLVCPPLPARPRRRTRRTLHDTHGGVAGKRNGGGGTWQRNAPRENFHTHRSRAILISKNPLAAAPTP